MFEIITQTSGLTSFTTGTSSALSGHTSVGRVPETVDQYNASVVTVRIAGGLVIYSRFMRSGDPTLRTIRGGGIIEFAYRDVHFDDGNPFFVF